MAATRKNTVVIDFTVLPTRPSAGSIGKFLSDELKIDMAAVKSLQLHTLRNCALVEMRSIEAAERIAASHHLKHTIEAGEKKFHIPVYVEDTAINIRIHDLPPGIPNTEIAEHMEQYGKVKSVARELWRKFFPGIPNGVRVVRIELKKHVPSFIRIQNQLTSVTYRSQVPTCRQCEKKAHPNQKCSEAAAEQKQARAAGPSNDGQPVQPKPSADNQDVANDRNDEQNQRVQENEQTGSSMCEAPPRMRYDCNEKVFRGNEQTLKQQTTRAKRSYDDHCSNNNNANDMDVECNASVDDDSDSGPVPARNDIDAWIIKFRKQSNRTDRFLKSLKNVK
ncbi:hypothetical protein RP20_CCG013796 [Aedes albopictus]|nr:hypothetical protein RP20_CCG013796 [Aedes albopictus]